MKAIIATGKGTAEFVDVPKPEAGPNQIVAQVKYAGICGTDVAIITGHTSFAEKNLLEYPVRIGHEWSGIITETGNEVTHLKVGDPVVSETSAACTRCPECRSGQSCPHARALGTIGHHWPGCFAEYMLMPAQGVHMLSERTDLREAALFEPATIAWQGIRMLDLQPGKTVLVIGTGPIGLTGAGILKALGMRVIVSGRRDSKLEYAKKMGADLVVNVRDTSLKQFFVQHTAHGYVDAIVEASGNPAVINECATLMKNGRIVMLGFFEKRIDGLDLDSFILNGNSIMSAVGVSGALQSVIRLSEQGRVDFKPLITGIYPFSRSLEAFDKVIANEDDRIKILISFE